MTNAVVVFVADFGLASAVAVRAPAAAGLVSAFVLAAAAVAEPVVAVASGPDLIFAARALVAVAAFVPAAFHADRAFALFALPAVLAAHRPLC